MRLVDLNHVALHVKDLEASNRFYGEQIGLSSIERPAFSFPGAWFRLGLNQELHLIGDREGSVQSAKRGTHFALQVESIDDAWQYLTERGVTCFSRQTRPDGAYQFYVEDPDGYILEFCQVNHLH